MKQAWATQVSPENARRFRERACASSRWAAPPMSFVGEKKRKPMDRAESEARSPERIASSPASACRTRRIAPSRRMTSTAVRSGMRTVVMTMDLGREARPPS